MELPGQEGDMPLPINSSYGGGHGHGHGHMIHHEPAPHNHIVPSSAAVHQVPTNGPTPTSSQQQLDDHVVLPPYMVNKKNMVKYRECLKNHAAAMGGTATDGCGEFMPSGEEGTLEALTCSACNCHRNFHRKEVEGGGDQPLALASSCDCISFGPHLNRVGSSLGGRKVILGHHHKGILGADNFGYHNTGTLVPSRAAPPHHMIMSYNMGSLPSESDEQEDGGGGGGGGGVVARPPQLVKKRFRTKFTQEQKEKMLSFAEKVGWKIQKQEESVVQQFCQEVGVKRRVLKVWMHNNKHSLAKKNHPSSTNPQNQI